MSCECHIVGRTAYDGVCLTPLDRFSKLDMSTALGLVPGLKMSASEISRRELSEDVSFGIGTGTLLVVEQSSLEKRWLSSNRAWKNVGCRAIELGKIGCRAIELGKTLVVEQSSSEKRLKGVVLYPVVRIP